MAFALCVEGVLGATSLRQRAGGGWLWASSRVFGAAAFLLVSAAVLRAAEDLVEFDRVEAAADFGWQASGGGALTAAAESAVGRFALQVTGVEGREYQGIRLRHDIDLTGARPDDVIVLHVKQNASDSVCVNLRLGEAHVYRYAPVTRGAWTRVVLDLDPGRWVNPKNVPWGLVPSLSVYTKGFDRADEVFLIDGFSVTVAGQAAAAVRGMADPTAWTFPQETAEAWLIGDADAAWAIERASGRVVGGWNVRTAQRYLAGATGRYHIEDRASLVTADEAADRVVGADVEAGAQRLTLRCVNEAIPGITIEKRYTLDGHRLLRRLAFELDEPRGRFVTYNAAVDLTPRFRDGGYYMHGLGALVPAPDVAATTRSERKGSPKLMLLHQPAAGYGFAHYRTHTNDRFVWPFFTGSIAGFLERMNVLSYTPRGWEMSMGTMPLQGGTGAASYGEAFSIFPGTWFDFFDREYRHLEPVQEALAAVPPVPSWVGDVVLYSGLPDMAHVRRLVEMTDEGTIVVLVSHWGSWADYRVDEGLVGQDGGFMDGPELKDLVARLHALSPRVKVCLYNLLWSATYEARTLAAHPEWFRHRNKDGQPLDFFPGCAPNYASLLSVPACYDELLRQCDLQFAYLDVDLLYLDIGCAVNLVDWESGGYTDDELCFRFLGDMKRVAAAHGPDKAVFLNGRGPWADLAFTEARGELRAGYWREYAGKALGMEMFGTYRPESRIIPLYWIDSLARDYVNRTLMMGWIPALEYGDPIARRPFAEAAYEFGNADPAPVRITPDWRSDPDTALESAIVRRRGDRGVVVSLIDHAKEPRTVEVTIALADLDLDRDGLVYVVDHAIADAGEFRGTVTTPVARRDYRDGGWRHDLVTQRRLLHVGPYAEALTLRLALEPLQLHQLVITDQPVAAWSHDDLPANYLFGTSRGVRITARTDVAARTVEAQVVCDRERAEVIALAPDGWSFGAVRLDGEAVEPAWTYECGRLCPVIRLSRGEHRLVLQADDAPTAAPAVAVQAALRDGRIELSPGGVWTLERAGRVVAAGAGSSISVAPVHPGGEYAITLRGLMRDGRAVPVAAAAAAAVNLPEAALRLPPDEPARSADALAVDEVGRTVQGIRVLRSATFRSGTDELGFQPALPGLTASVDVEGLRAEAGTTRKVAGFTGAAAAGFEVEGVRKVQVRLDNSFFGAFSLRARGQHVTMYRRNSREFAGFVVDYHTPAGYSRRVILSVGVMHPECSSASPPYGRDARADARLDLGDLMNESASQVFALDLAATAPADWDGRAWLSVATDAVASDRRLTMTILAVNDGVNAAVLEGSDPGAVRALFEQPRRVEVPRAPQAPVLDGIVDEEAWQAAAVIDRFFLVGGAAFPQSPTQARLFYDDEFLYVAFALRDPERAKPQINHGSLWHDDDVELWIDVDGDGKTYHQVIANGAGAAVEFQADGAKAFGARVAGHAAGDGAWSVEMAVPFAGLGIASPKPGDTWQINLARHRPPGERVGVELITWGPLRAGFNELGHFGTAVFR